MIDIKFIQSHIRKYVYVPLRTRSHKAGLEIVLANEVMALLIGVLWTRKIPSAYT